MRQKSGVALGFVCVVVCRELRCCGCDYGTKKDHLQGAFVSDVKEFVEAGLRIRALRGKATQGEFAECVGVNRKTVERWESGERLPDGQSLLALMTVCGADVNYILTGQRGHVAPTLSPKERTLVDLFRDASKDVQNAVLGALVGISPAAGAEIRDVNMTNHALGGVQVGVQLGGKVQDRRKVR